MPRKTRAQKLRTQERELKAKLGFAKPPGGPKRGRTSRELEEYARKWQSYYVKKVSRYTVEELVSYYLQRYAPFFVFCDKVARDGERVLASPEFHELGLPPGIVRQAAMAFGLRKWTGFQGLTAMYRDRDHTLLGEFPFCHTRGYNMAEMVWGTELEAGASPAMNDFRTALCREGIRRYLGPNTHRSNIITSFGLLEHFKDGEVRDLVADFKGYHQVHYVPLEGHGQPSFGDERLLSLSHWRDLLDLQHYETFNQGKDLVFVVFAPNMGLRRKPVRWEVEENGDREAQALQG
jgi:hypothetical protein